MDYRIVFEAITTAPRYLANLDWGEARPGHPEGRRYASGYVCCGTAVSVC